MWSDDDCEFDPHPRVVLLTEPGEDCGSAWVHAWVFVPADRIDKEITDG
jgi:hypothetical protein